MRAADAKKRGQVYHNPWDLGLVSNVAMVLGTRDAPYNWMWWIWPTLGLPPGDGFIYSMRRDLTYTMVPRAGDADAGDKEMGQLTSDAIIPDAQASHVE